ncbi:Uncharacterized protein APZ42_006739 [Daphnia magna]|uniref:Uncharacterized protein n=1 Tax=Daphnia magna TaxID=35525 RepID=A0A164FQH0_9CRUS|nr:Uncharacterized protein APZ42_006739 [Daphnia magna]
MEPDATQRRVRVARRRFTREQRPVVPNAPEHVLAPVQNQALLEPAVEPPAEELENDALIEVNSTEFYITSTIFS